MEFLLVLFVIHCYSAWSRSLLCLVKYCDASPENSPILLVIIIVESAEKLNAELRELRVQHYTLKEQYDDLKEKMKFFTKVIFKGRLTLSFLPSSHCFHVGDISA